LATVGLLTEGFAFLGFEEANFPARVVRTMRVLRLMDYSPPLRRLMLGIGAMLADLLNVALITLLAVWIYAVTAIFLFGNVKRGEKVKLDSFKTFTGSMQMLFMVMVNDNWDVMMDDCAVLPPECTGDGDAGFEFGECGSPGSVPFFISLVITTNFVMLNLVVAVIINRLGAFYQVERLALVLSPAELLSFAEKWEELAGDIWNDLAITRLPKLLKSMPGTIGTKGRYYQMLVRAELLYRNHRRLVRKNADLADDNMSVSVDSQSPRSPPESIRLSRLKSMSMLMSGHDLSMALGHTPGTSFTPTQSKSRRKRMMKKLRSLRKQRSVLEIDKVTGSLGRVRDRIMGHIQQQEELAKLMGDKMTVRFREVIITCMYWLTDPFWLTNKERESRKEMYICVRAHAAASLFASIIRTKIQSRRFRMILEDFISEKYQEPRGDATFFKSVDELKRKIQAVAVDPPRRQTQQTPMEAAQLAALMLEQEELQESLQRDPRGAAELMEELEFLKHENRKRVFVSEKRKPLRTRDVNWVPRAPAATPINPRGRQMTYQQVNSTTELARQAQRRAQRAAAMWNPVAAADALGNQNIAKFAALAAAESDETKRHEIEAALVSTRGASTASSEASGRKTPPVSANKTPLRVSASSYKVSTFKVSASSHRDPTSSRLTSRRSTCSVSRADKAMAAMVLKDARGWRVSRAEDSSDMTAFHDGTRAFPSLAISPSHSVVSEADVEYLPGSVPFHRWNNGVWLESRLLEHLPKRESRASSKAGSRASKPGSVAGSKAGSKSSRNSARSKPPKAPQMHGEVIFADVVVPASEQKVPPSKPVPASEPLAVKAVDKPPPRAQADPFWRAKSATTKEPGSRASSQSKSRTQLKKSQTTTKVTASEAPQEVPAVWMTSPQLRPELPTSMPTERTFPSTLPSALQAVDSMPTEKFHPQPPMSIGGDKEKAPSGRSRPAVRSVASIAESVASNGTQKRVGSRRALTRQMAEELEYADDYAYGDVGSVVSRLSLGKMSPHDSASQASNDGTSRNVLKYSIWDNVSISGGID